MERDPPPTLSMPPGKPASRWLRSRAGVIGLVFLALMFLACIGTAWWTMARITPAGVGPDQHGTPRYAWQEREARQLPPSWWPSGRTEEVNTRLRLTAEARARETEALSRAVSAETVAESGWTPSDAQVRAAHPTYLMGTDILGRDVFVRCLAGGGISLTIGLMAAAVAVFIGTIYGAIAGYAGGRIDAVMMRIVDILYGLPYVLLVVLLAVAADAVMDEYISRARVRAAWVRAVSERLGDIPHNDASTPEQIEKWAAAMTATLPEFRHVILGALQRDWEWQRKQARDEQKAKDRALRKAKGEHARSLAQKMTVRAIAPTPPGEPELEQFQRGSSSRNDAIQRAAPLQYPERKLSDSTRLAYDLLSLLFAIGGVSWLTMARVIRGQVLSLKSQPFVEAARAIGAPTSRIFLRHLLPNLVGPIIVYATLTVPQAILQESFLSFLGIGVKPPAPSWGNLAAEGIAEGINPHRLSDSRWWLLVFPCALLGCTLLALNFVGEGLREAMDPKRTKR
jgi:ABC-type dipeptide/oligopeptide/nickel transport system permease subunit